MEIGEKVIINTGNEGIKAMEHGAWNNTIEKGKYMRWFATEDYRELMMRIKRRMQRTDDKK